MSAARSAVARAAKAATLYADDLIKPRIAVAHCPGCGVRETCLADGLVEESAAGNRSAYVAGSGPTRARSRARTAG